MDSLVRPFRVARFEGGRLDLNSGELDLEGQTIRLQPKPLSLLVALMEHPGRVIGREELRARLWPDDTNVVFDQGIDTSIRKLRLAFNDDAVHPRFIETLPRRGHRWLKTVAWEVRRDVAAAQPGDLALVGRECRASRPTDSTTGVASDEACLRGRQALNQLSQESVQRARAWFEHAIAVDGTCGPAYSGLARSCFASSHFSLEDSNELMALAKEAALRAVSLNENDAEAHATLGQIAGAFDYDWQEALNCHHRVLKCRPASLLAQQWCAQFILLPLRRFDEAIAMLEPLLVVEPCELFLRKTFGEALLMRGDYAEAIEQLRRVVALDATFWLGCFALGNAYSLSGDDASAVEAYESAMRRTSFGPLVGTLAAVYSRTGSIARSQSLLEAHTRDSPRRVQAKTLMWYHFGVADFVQAAACLAELIRARDPDAIWVGHAPKTWRESPPVRKLLSDIGLA